MLVASVPEVLAFGLLLVAVVVAMHAGSSSEWWPPAACGWLVPGKQV